MIARPYKDRVTVGCDCDRNFILITHNRIVDSNRVRNLALAQNSRPVVDILPYASVKLTRSQSKNHVSVFADPKRASSTILARCIRRFQCPLPVSLSIYRKNVRCFDLSDLEFKIPIATQVYVTGQVHTCGHIRFDDIGQELYKSLSRFGLSDITTINQNISISIQRETPLRDSGF